MATKPTLLEMITNLVGQAATDGLFLMRDSTREEGLRWGTPIATDNDLDHVAQKLSMVGVPWDPMTANHTDLGLSAGYVIGQEIRPGNAMMTNAVMWLTAAGTGATGENKMFLMDDAYKVLAVTADISTELADNGNNGTFLEVPFLTPYQGMKGQNYYVCCLSHMSVIPTVGGILDGGGVAVPKYKNHWDGIEISGITSVPAVNSSFSSGSVIAAPAAYFFAAS